MRFAMLPHLDVRPGRGMPHPMKPKVLYHNSPTPCWQKVIWGASPIVKHTNKWFEFHLAVERDGDILAPPIVDLFEDAVISLDALDHKQPPVVHERVRRLGGVLDDAPPKGVVLVFDDLRAVRPHLRQPARRVVDVVELAERHQPAVGRVAEVVRRAQ